MSATFYICLGITFVYFSRFILQMVVNILRIQDATLFSRLHELSTFLFRIVHTFNTLIHELGHIVIAILVGFKPKCIKLNINTSGSAHYLGKSKAHLRSALVSFAGYSTASIFAVILAVLIKLYEPDKVFMGLTIVVGLSLILLLRNLYGVIWSVMYLALSGYLIYTENIYWQEVMLNSISYSIILGSFISTINVYVSAKTKSKSDISTDTIGLEYHTGITRTFWGYLFITLGLVCSYLAINVFLGDNIKELSEVIPILKSYLYLN